MEVVGEGLSQGFLTESQIRTLASRGLARLELDGQRVLVLIPDGTRTMPMPLIFEILEQELGGKAASLDFLVALGTHPPMSDIQLAQLIGRPVLNGRAGRNRIYNHRWDDSTALVKISKPVSVSTVCQSTSDGSDANGRG